ncbi:Hypothetical predicted protein, partial [Pelobates cultripes]
NLVVIRAIREYFGDFTQLSPKQRTVQAQCLWKVFGECPPGVSGVWIRDLVFPGIEHNALEKSQPRPFGSSGPFAGFRA